MHSWPSRIITKPNHSRNIFGSTRDKTLFLNKSIPPITLKIESWKKRYAEIYLDALLGAKTLVVDLWNWLWHILSTAQIAVSGEEFSKGVVSDEKTNLELQGSRFWIAMNNYNFFFLTSNFKLPTLIFSNKKLTKCIKSLLFQRMSLREQKGSLFSDYVWSYLFKM